MSVTSPSGPTGVPAPAIPTVRNRPISKMGVTITTMMAMISMIMTSTMVNVAIPDIMGAYGIGQDRAHWMATGFLAAMTVSMLLNAWLMGKFGPRLVFLGGVGLFVIACLAGFVAASFEGVVVARVFQGLCAGIIQPLSMSTVFLVYSPEERGKAMGWFGMGVVFGPTIGPVLGGIIVDEIAWRWVFPAPIPIMALSALLGWLYLPGRDANTPKPRLNVVSLLLISAATVLFLNGITQGQREGWTSESAALMLFGSMAALATFIFRELGSDNPLINLRLFSIKAYTASAIVAFIFGAGMFGTLFLTPVMVQTVQGFTATKAGMMLLPGGIVAMCVFPIAGRLSQRFPPTVTITSGLFVFGVSCWLLAGAELAAAFWWLAFLVALGRIGLGVVIPALNLGAMSALPRELVPAGSGALNFIRMTGAAIGVNALAILIDDRIASHGQILSETQAPNNPATSALLETLRDRLAPLGLPEDVEGGVSLSYLRALIDLKAQEQAFHDGFIAMTFAFAAGMLATVLLLRRKSDP